jgi:hypothetical protein
LIHYDDVQSCKLALVCSERLPDQPLQAIAAAGQPAAFFADRQTEAGFVALVAATKNRKQGIAASRRFAEYATERLGIGKPAPGTKAAVRLNWRFCFVCRRTRDRMSSGLRRQARAAFRATAFQNESAAFRRHSCSEPMRTGSLQFTGLKCAFHCDLTWRFSRSDLRVNCGANKMPPGAKPHRKKAGKGTREVLFCQ